MIAASTLAIFFLIAINILRNRRFEESHHQSIEAIKQDVKRWSTSRYDNLSFDTRKAHTISFSNTLETTPKKASRRH